VSTDPVSANRTELATNKGKWVTIIFDFNEDLRGVFLSVNDSASGNVVDEQFGFLVGHVIFSRVLNL
jgi:hypothetical protein